MNKLSSLLIAAASLLPATITNACAEPAGSVANIVLVDGAFADGSGWKGVADILRKDGFNVAIAQPPLTSLEDDVAATKRILERQKAPVILVGHSYGGAIISAVGNMGT